MKETLGNIAGPSARTLPPRLRTDRHRHRRAFTRIELAVVLAVTGMLSMLVMTALAGTRGSSERSVCFGNLRAIGNALTIWSGDYQGRMPWRVPVSEGGTYSVPKPGNAWYEFAWFSNQLVTPKILVCPADNPPKMAATWGVLLSPFYRANALSYSLGLDVLPEWPRSAVCLDRNAKLDSGVFTCSAGVNNAASASTSPQSLSLAWTNAVHGENAGHVLQSDGSVDFTTSAELRGIIRRSDDNGSVHFLKAR